MTNYDLLKDCDYAFVEWYKAHNEEIEINMFGNPNIDDYGYKIHLLNEGFLLGVKYG